jgi:hypothetical protein
MALVKRFQELVWVNEKLGVDPRAEEVLRVLAYDLDFFEPE